MLLLIYKENKQSKARKQGKEGRKEGNNEKRKKRVQKTEMEREKRERDRHKRATRRQRDRPNTQTKHTDKKRAKGINKASGRGACSNVERIFCSKQQSTITPKDEMCQPRAIMQVAKYIIVWPPRRVPQIIRFKRVFATMAQSDATLDKSAQSAQKATKSRFIHYQRVLHTTLIVI